MALYTPAEREQITNDVLAKQSALVAEVAEKTAEIARLNDLLQNAVTLEQFQALQAQFDAATLELNRVSGELSAADEQFKRLKDATDPAPVPTE